MNVTGIVVAILLVLIAAFFIFQHRGSVPDASASMSSVTLSDVPRVHRLVTQSLEDGRFAVFLFGPNGEAPAPIDALNVQFSIENGRVGIDWVLLAQLNMAERERVSEFFQSASVRVREREMNDVRYLRVEDGDLAMLLRDLLVNVFGVTPSQRMDLIAEGFEFEG